MDISNDGLELDSKIVGALPILNHFIDRLGLSTLIDKWVPSHVSQTLSHATVILLLARNILIERRPLYEIPNWASRHDPHGLELGTAKTKLLNDDRIGRSLNALFDSDRASLMTELVLRIISEFKVELSELHNDSTTVTFSGQYQVDHSYHGKTAALIIPGFNKDHRPDLKQLVFSLSVSRDGAVPIHCKLYDGNTTDDTTHIQTWESLRRIAGQSDFIYVADSKLCTKEQMAHIAREQGRFITVLPKTRSEDTWFRKWIQTHPARWQVLLKRPNHRKPKGAPCIYRGFESPLPSEEGYRIIWILSSQKQRLDAHLRQKKINKTVDALDRLKSKIETRNLKSKEWIADAVSDILLKCDSERWFCWKIITQNVESFKQKGKGRPGKKTEYVKVVRQRFSFEALPDDPRIQNDAVSDGIFPLITNISAQTLSMTEILQKYKYQPYIEKRHEQFKSVFDAAPVFLKLPHRVEALMFVYFLVLLLNALIERALRQAMSREKIKSLPLYPEERECRLPSTEKILQLFSNHRKSILLNGKKHMRTFADPLSDLQQQVLYLLEISPSLYS